MASWGDRFAWGSLTQLQTEKQYIPDADYGNHFGERFDIEINSHLVYPTITLEETLRKWPALTRKKGNLPHPNLLLQEKAEEREGQLRRKMPNN